MNTFFSLLSSEAPGLCGFARRLQQIIYDMGAGYLVIGNCFRAALVTIDQLCVIEA